MCSTVYIQKPSLYRMSDYDNNVDNLDMDGKHEWQNRLICTIAVLGKALEVKAGLY